MQVSGDKRGRFAGPLFLLLRLMGLILILLFLSVLATIPFEDDNPISLCQHALVSFSWSIANWMPISNLSASIQQYSWQYYTSSEESPVDYHLEIPRISIPDLLLMRNLDTQPSDHGTIVKTYLERTYGKDWHEQPLLLEGILDYASPSKSHRNLSLHGLLHLDQIIPYFQRAYQEGALTPTANAPVSDIVQGMLDGKPYKIGSQLIVQEHPEWLEEMTGSSTTMHAEWESKEQSTGNLLSELFGNHFDAEHLQQGRVFPATTTVPVFVAGIQSTSSSQHTLTGLHCEPIGNVAFQIEGEKEWTLVDPKHSARLHPSLAADGRAFFSSSLQNDNFDSYDDPSLSNVLTKRQIPHWTAVTKSSDALWVPTWTWHRVDYRQQQQKQCSEHDTSEATIAIGGSIFHFRAWDFLRRNPLYAVMIVPALMKELAGISTQ